MTRRLSPSLWAAATLVVATGCSSMEAPDEMPSATASPPSPHSDRPRSSLVGVPLTTLTPGTGLPFTTRPAEEVSGALVGPAEAVAAPPLGSQPDFVASYAYQRRLTASPGREGPLAYGVMLLTGQDGGTRRLELGSLGVANPTAAERGFALSPDGTRLAVADPGRILLVDVESADVFAEHEVAADEPVALKFSPDAQTLVFKDRNAASDAGGVALSLGDGALSPAPDPIGSALRDTGAIDLRDQPDGTVVVEKIGDDERDLSTLRTRLDGQARPVCATLCAVVQTRTFSLGRQVARGVLTFDPDTGLFGPALALDETEANGAQLLGWRDPRTVVMAVPTPEGTQVAAWDVARDEVRAVASFALGDMELDAALG